MVSVPYTARASTNSHRAVSTARRDSDLDPTSVDRDDLGR